MVITGTVAVIAAVSHVGLTLYDGIVSNERRAKQRVLEKELLEGELEKSFQAYKQLCQLREDLEKDAYQARRKQAEQLLLDNMIFASEMSNIDKFNLLIPPIALSNDVLMNIIYTNDEDEGQTFTESHIQEIGAFSYKPLKVFITPTNDENINKSIWVRVIDQLDDFFAERYNCNSTHQVSLFTDSWKNEDDLPNSGSISNIHAVLDKDPIVFVCPTIKNSKLSINLFFWGVGSSYDLNHHDYRIYTVPENNKSDSSYFTFMINHEESNNDVIQEIVSQIKASICVLCDIYSWNQYYIVPAFPNILKSDNSIESNLINQYISLLEKSIDSGALSRVINVDRLLNYAKTVDKAFDSKKCATYLLNKIKETNNRGNNKTIFDPSMGSGFFDRLIENFEKQLKAAEEGAEKAIKKVESFINSFDDEDNNRTDSPNPQLSHVDKNSSIESVSYPIINVVSPRFNYSIWQFYKENSSFYGINDSILNNQYKLYVQSVIQYQAVRYFKNFYNKHNKPWTHYLLYQFFSNEVLNRDFFEAIFTTVDSFIENNKGIGEKLNNCKKRKEQEELEYNVVNKLKRILYNKIKEIIDYKYVCQAFKRSCSDYFSYTIDTEMDCFGYISDSDSNRIDKDDLTELIPSSIIGDVSSEMFDKQRQNRISFIQALLQKFSINEKKQIINIVAQNITNNYISDDAIISQHNFVIDERLLFLLYLSMSLTKYYLRIKKSNYFKPDIYEDSIDYTTKNKSEAHLLIVENFFGLMRELCLIHYFIEINPYIKPNSKEASNFSSFVIKTDIKKIKSDKDQYEWLYSYILEQI